MRSMRSMSSPTCDTPDCASTATPSWRRIFHWPLFGLLALVHLTVLPLLLAEPDDQAVAAVGGVAYLALAALDLRHRRRPPLPTRG
jgi:hypothetical protein